MCYNYHIIATKPTPNCSLCGSALILVSKTTSTLEGYRYPQTQTIYRCSNQECQEEKDKETVKRLKLKEDRALADSKREAIRLEKKMKLAKDREQEI